MIAEWKFDLSTAPRGQRFGDKNQNFRPDWILVCFHDKGVAKILPTHFVEPSKQHPDGRWAGLATKQIPYAWDHYPEIAEPPAAEEESSW